MNNIPLSIVLYINKYRVGDIYVTYTPLLYLAVFWLFLNDPGYVCS
jgi:hypothetical protein